MTLVGDVAQSTTPAGQERWADIFAYLSIGDTAIGDTAGEGVGTVAELTIGYRVPEPILTVANRLLPLTGVDASASRSVRVDGHPPAWLHTAAHELPAAVAQAAATMKHRHRLTGVVAPLDLHDAIAAALEPVGLHAVDHLHQLHPGEIPLFGPEQVKGLEFDGVVVVEPDEILGATPRGARLLYVAMTRAVQDLSFVTTAAPERPGRAWHVLGGPMP
jgi:DNA helicase IV